MSVHRRLMAGFPPASEDQVTLANWRLPPFNRWAFSRVRELIPTAAIAASADHLRRKCQNIGLAPLAIARPEGGSVTFTEWLEETSTDGLAVVKEGLSLAEIYPGDLGPGRPHILFSVSKSITALIAGILTGERLFDPDWPVVRLIPEAKGTAYGGCTLRHVLDMTVAIAFDEAYLDPESAFARYRQSMLWNPPSRSGDAGRPGDLRGFLLTLEKGEGGHGEVFHYVSPNSDLLGWALERASGRRYADLVSDLLWRPMGALHEGSVTLDGLGGARAAGGISASLSDLARVGEVVLGRGSLDRRQICPAVWIDDLWTGGDRAAWLKGQSAALFPEGRYRSQWYATGNDHRSLAAIGIHGQWLWIDPVTKVVVAKLSSQPLPVDDALDRLTIAGLETIAREV